MGWERGAAFDAFYLAHQNRLRAYVARLIRDPYTVEDVVQDTFLRAYTRGVYEDARDPWVWLSVVARNLAFDNLRWSGRRPSRTLDGVPDPPASEDSDPEVTVRTKLWAQHVRRTMGSLSPRHRELLAAKYLEDRAYRDIARSRNETLDAVQAGLARARHNFLVAFRSTAEDRFPVVVLGGALARIRWKMRAASARLVDLVEHVSAAQVAVGMNVAGEATAALVVAGSAFFVGGVVSAASPVAAPVSLDVSDLPAVAQLADAALAQREPAVTHVAAAPEDGGVRARGQASPDPTPDPAPSAPWSVGVDAPPESPAEAAAAASVADDEQGTGASAGATTEPGTPDEGRGRVENESYCSGLVMGTVCTVEDALPLEAPPGA